MIFILILYISLCLITLGTLIPTLYLGLKIQPEDRSVFFVISGLTTGIMFVIADGIGGPVHASLWGPYAWIPMVALLGLFFYINCYQKFGLRQALRINFFMQALLLSAIPMSRFCFYDISMTERFLLYFSLILSLAFVIYNSAVLLLPYAAGKSIYHSGIYIFVVIMLLIVFEPFTKTSSYTELMNRLSMIPFFLPLRISLLIHLAVIPLISLIPYFIIKHLFRAPHKPGM